MFTGIVTDIGTIETVDESGDLRLRIACSPETASAPIGGSIAFSGVCLTVVDKGDAWVSVDVSRATRERTAPGRWAVGQRLNLERPLKVGDELGGHIVTGHVDGVASVTAADPEGGSTRIRLEADDGLAPFIAEKGSIALDGVSLTVNEVEDDGDKVGFYVNVIPHTADQTTLGALEAGDSCHVEIDILARYLHRMHQFS